MADKCLVEPNLEFIKEVVGLGGDTLKKCFQCATCSVVCPIAPENKPFPRKEMIAASWGLKDKLVGSMDIWLCHNCGDCTTMCPRGAKPGDVLGAIRSYAISEYAVPKFIGKAVNDPKKLPVLLGLPVVIFLVLGFITGLLDFTPGGDEIVHSNFFSSWLVDMIFVPLAAWAVVVFGIGLKRFVNDMHENAVLEGKTDKKKLEIGGLIRGLLSVIPTILKHSKFSECDENKERATAHLMVFYSFIGLFIVTNIFFVVLYVFQIHGPYSQMNPVKWLANVSGIALIIGSALMIKNRMGKTDQVTSYKDWYLLILVLGLGATGMLTEMTRLAGIAGLSYALYFIHLMFVFHLFIFLPFSKLAHLVYRTVAMAYGEYGNR
ncbi:MAG: quinone-interacting membrane-bound oxidoreductase complex subunit QmoC [Desulfobacteraceae bacterium]|nr:quinone-interacting membrane-bound oxidoreductase complex subunit QmoC [Pseudomonadota bacterium]MBU4462940.1 quinone-interacting membrane-bound oxidoreductase complex subunit QmoC [Pseudomonadota bacterium]MCG2755808.1 quinone-interacting membrane-bound oxidoreductase complex subunit QmoC [Desulfobacteraceae bacterium]